MIELTSKQRKVLEKIAVDLNTMVIVGQNGISDSVENQIVQCLNNHELIKIKFNEYKDEKKELALELSKQIDCTLVRVIGNIAILYKESDDPEKQNHFLG